MKLMKRFSRRKIDVERHVIGCIDAFIQLIEIYMRSEGYEDLEKNINDIIEIGTEFEKNILSLHEQLEYKFYLPFYWQDIYLITTYLEKMNSLLQMYYNKSIIYKSTDSYKGLFTQEIKILENVKSFFSEFLNNRMYVKEILKNNSYEIKEFSQSIYKVLSRNSKELFLDRTISEIIEVFEMINFENENINNVIKKIFIETNL